MAIAAGRCDTMITMLRSANVSIVGQDTSRSVACVEPAVGSSSRTHRSVAQDRSGESDAASLAGGEVPPAFVDRDRSAHRGRARPRRAPRRTATRSGVRGRRAGRCRRRAGEQVRRLVDPGELAPASGRVELRRAARDGRRRRSPRRAEVGRRRAEQHRQQGRLADAARPVITTIWPTDAVNPAVRAPSRPATGVRDARLSTTRARRSGRRSGTSASVPFSARRCLKDRERPLGGGESVGGGVVARADLAQRAGTPRARG